MLRYGHCTKNVPFISPININSAANRDNMTPTFTYVIIGIFMTHQQFSNLILFCFLLGHSIVCPVSTVSFHLLFAVLANVHIFFRKTPWPKALVK